MGVPKSQMQFCHICAAWSTKGEWDNHCLRHLGEPSKHCGSIVIRRTVIRPAYCPFCRNSNRSPGARMRSWDRDADAIKHIKAEEIKHTYPATCCGVVLATELDVDCHLADVHGYAMRKASCPKRPGEKTIRSPVPVAPRKERRQSCACHGSSVTGPEPIRSSCEETRWGAPEHAVQDWTTPIPGHVGVGLDSQETEMPIIMWT